MLYPHSKSKRFQSKPQRLFLSAIPCTIKQNIWAIVLIIVIFNAIGFNFRLIVNGIADRFNRWVSYGEFFFKYFPVLFIHVTLCLVRFILFYSDFVFSDLFGFSIYVCLITLFYFIFLSCYFFQLSYKLFQTF